MRRILAALVLILSSLHNISYSGPKLIVVISLDQFRYDYLTRFREHYGTTGFRYLMQHGACFSNAVYKHASTSTGPGYAAMLTGAYGNQNGIVANTWYDATNQRDVYCVEDKRVTNVGAAGEGRSPFNLFVPTFGDELRLHTGFRSKVISISEKDRAAILMGGNMASGAFWLVDSVFATSTYYTGSLPEWVRKFNSSGIINSFFGKRWQRVLPEDSYATLDDDDVPYSSNWSTIGKKFPHLIQGDDPARITKSYYNALRTSPFSTEILEALAKAAIAGEHLGDGKFTDLLCIGFSATDEVGHSFGPHSREILEIAVQTDRIVGDFLQYIDSRVGLKNAVVVLTSDHGVSPIPEYLRAHYPNADAGRISRARLMEFCNASLTAVFGSAGTGKSWVKRILADNIYIDRDLLASKQLELEKVTAVLADSLMNLHGVTLAVPRHLLLGGYAQHPLAVKLARSFHPKRSGDVLFALRPFYYLDESTVGAEHGYPYDHDAHVPIIIMGEGIRSGTYATECSPVDIGPTLSALLGIEFPAGREGRVLVEALNFP